MAEAFTPYSTAAPYFGAKPAWVPDPLDVARIQAYDTYERMYWNSPEVFKISLRGSNNMPIFVPSARTIVDTTARYVGADFRVVVTGQETESVAAGQLAITDLIRRERFRSKFNGAKRYGLIQGDWVWYVTADPAKPVGSRIKITAIDPSQYFPLTSPDDVDRVIGFHLAETTTTEDGERVRRITYLKTDGGVTVQEGLYKVDNWYSVDAPVETVIRPPTALPTPITSLPTYHTKNTEVPGDPFGSSELRSLEPIMAGLNQTMSDEDLTLAIMGIGMYATDASRPIDPETKKPVNWQMGPGRVLHHDGTRFDKVSGVGNLAESYGEHYNRLWESVYQSSSTPEIAVGSSSVAMAESGVALQLRLGPMLSKAREKNDLLLDSHNQMFHDILTQWMAAYEETTFAEGTDVECVVGDAVPTDREARFVELNDMLDRGVIDTVYYRTEAAKLGYTFDAGVAARATAEFEARQAQDFGARLTAETDNGQSS